MKKIYLFLFSALIGSGVFAQFVPVATNLALSGNIVLGSSNYHVSESIYLNEEIGNNNFTTAGSAIQQLFFLLEVPGTVTTVNNYKISMKNIAAATTTLATGVYSAAGYTVVFNGTITTATAGLVPITLTTPFVHTAGSNIQILIERTDNVVHGDGATNNIWDASTGNVNNAAALSSRRYNSTTAPTAGVTSLTASAFRPAIAFNHTFAIDAIVNDILFTTTSCFTAPQPVGVEIINGGTTAIAAGAATVTLHIRGANTFTGTATNTGAIASGGSELVIFNNINFANEGINFDTAWVTVPGDGTTYYDTLSTASNRAYTLNTFPLIEDAETVGQLPVVPYSETIALDDLWSLWNGPYTNTDQTTALNPHSGSNMFLFDSYSGANSTGTESRLYSNCINLTTATAALLTFYMSHDNIFATALDSIYVSVSTDKGQSWTRLTGFQRPDATAAVPTWQLHSVNLAAYLGQIIQIGFEGTSQYGNAILLDDINITATLPVSVLNFNAQRNGKVNDLSWKTAQEINSSRFVIERSIDGGNTYSEIGQVAAAGSSNSERSYRFTDPSPYKGYNYYRLRIVDLDNKFKYSDVRNVRNLGSADFSIAPNPVVLQTIKLKIDADKADQGTVIITDMSGKQVYSNVINVEAGSNFNTINAGHLAPGLYIIQVKLSDDRIVKKFNKL